MNQNSNEPTLNGLGRSKWVGPIWPTHLTPLGLTLAHAQSSIDMCKDGREIVVAINDQIEYYF